jgi:ABC-type oligopeptide transport system substrate-binding subunit
MNIAFSENLIIALGAMIVVLLALILYAISLISKISSQANQTEGAGNTASNTTQNLAYNNQVSNNVQSFAQGDDEEDRLVVALAASAMAASDKPDSYFHITKITRVQ